jgi:predicted lactoylglutathione lyase
MSGTPVDLKLEVVVLPVSDVDRSKRFYEGLGWRVGTPISPASMASASCK